MGVVEWSTDTRLVRELDEAVRLAILLCDEALKLCLKLASICRGKVWPFSQISTSFLIFSYMEDSVSGHSSRGHVESQWTRHGILRRWPCPSYTCLLPFSGCVPFDHQGPNGLYRSSGQAAVPSLYEQQQRKSHLWQHYLWVGPRSWLARPIGELQSLRHRERLVCVFRELS